MSFSEIPYLPLVLQQQNDFSLTINATDMVSIEGKGALVTDNLKYQLALRLILEQAHSLDSKSGSLAPQTLKYGWPHRVF